MTPIEHAPRWLAAVPDAAGYRYLRILGSQHGVPHVLGLARQRSSGGADIVVKRCGIARGDVAAAALAAVGRGLSGRPNAPLAVPRVVAWHRRQAALCLTAAAGLPVRPLLDTARRPATLDAVARALACLHSLTLRTGRATDLDDHWRDLVPAGWQAAADGRADLAARVRAGVAALRRHAAAQPPTPRVPIHRDCHARQMFLDGNRVWLVDWDVFARGDAALDVANFAVYLRTHLVNGMDAASAFRDRYAAHGDAAVLERTPRFEALTCLRLACKAMRLQPAGWIATATRRIAEAERALDRG